MLASRQSTVAIIGVAVILAVLAPALFFLVPRWFSPDPSSEVFVVLDAAPYSPDWREAEWKDVPSTVERDLLQHFTTPDFDVAEIDMDQSLFRYTYSDYLGNETFTIRYGVWGHASKDFSEYSFAPSVTGGGNVQAAALIESEFDPESLVLTVRIHQQFSNTREAKETALQFQWDGEKFVLKEDAEMLEE